MNDNLLFDNENESAFESDDDSLSDKYQIKYNDEKHQKSDEVKNVEDDVAFEDNDSLEKMNGHMGSRKDVTCSAGRGVSRRGRGSRGRGGGGGRWLGYLGNGRWMEGFDPSLKKTSTMDNRDGDDENGSKSDSDNDETTGTKRRKKMKILSPSQRRKVEMIDVQEMRSDDFSDIKNDLDICEKISYRPLLPEKDDNGKESFLSLNFDEGLFADETKCPICLDVFENTLTVMACLHRFCSHCLQRTLRMGGVSHECPLCRVKLASRRSCKPDLVYDNIIGMLQLSNNIPCDGLSSTSIPALQAHVSSSSSATPLSSELLTSPRSNNGIATQDSQRSSPILQKRGLDRNDNMTKEDIARYRKTHEDNIAILRQRQKEKLLAGSLAKCINSKSSSSSIFGNVTNNMYSSSGESRVSWFLRGSNSEGDNREHADKDCDTSILSGTMLPNLLNENERKQMVTLGMFPLTVPDAEKISTRINLVPLRKPYLRMPAMVCIADVKQFLKLKYSSVGSSFNVDHLDLFIRYEGKEVLLEDNFKIGDLCVTHWDRESELNILYSISDKT